MFKDRLIAVEKGVSSDARRYVSKRTIKIIEETLCLKPMTTVKALTTSIALMNCLPVGSFTKNHSDDSEKTVIIASCYARVK